MAAAPETLDFRDLQTTVLQTTLQEISSRPTDLADSSLAAKDCCVICLDEITEACEAQPCHHRNFDYLCLVTWLQQQITCPLCKTEITEIRYEFGTDEKEWKTFKTPERRPEKKDDGGNVGVQNRRYNPSTYRRRSRRSPQPQWYQHGGVTPSQDEALSRRRLVYRRQLYSLHIGSNRYSHYRELTPQLFMSDTDLVSRARMWLRRELQVFDFLALDSDAASDETDPVRRRRANNAEFLLEYIIAILKTVDIQGSSGHAEDLIQEFLGRENTRLLLHELKSWLRSPNSTTLLEWDRSVQYPQAPSQRTRSRSPMRRDEQQSQVVTYPDTWRRGDKRTRTDYRHRQYSSRRYRNQERLRDATSRYHVD